MRVENNFSFVTAKLTSCSSPHHHNRPFVMHLVTHHLVHNDVFFKLFMPISTSVYLYYISNSRKKTIQVTSFLLLDVFHGSTKHCGLNLSLSLLVQEFSFSSRYNIAIKLAWKVSEHSALVIFIVNIPED